MYQTFEGHRKGSVLFEHDMFEYKRNKRVLGCQYLECTTPGCPGRAVIKDATEILSVTKEHDHGPLQSSHFSVKKAKASMKRKAEESASSLRDIFDQTRLT